MHVAYVRHVGPYAGDAQLFEGLWQKLCTWAGPRGLIRPPETKMLSIYHDDPNITDEEKLRVSVCLTVPPDTEVDGEIGAMQVPGGRYAVARFELDPSQYGDAWGAVYGGWLPNSGFQPDDRPAFESGPTTFVLPSIDDDLPDPRDLGWHVITVDHDALGTLGAR